MRRAQLQPGGNDAALAALRYSTGAAAPAVAPPAAPLSAAAARKAAADEEVRAWMAGVLQPGPALYDGHGVARPSAFIKAGPSFVRGFEKLMVRRGRAVAARAAASNASSAGGPRRAWLMVVEEASEEAVAGHHA